MRYFLFLCILVFSQSLSSQSSSQEDRPYVKVKSELSLLRQSVIPTALIIGGIAITGSEFEKEITRDIRASVGEDYNLPIDDYLVYVPIAEMYIADGLGVEAKNHWFDQTKYLVISNVITAAITHGLKNTIDKERPTGFAHSFPSGHTSFAFTNAAVLHEEFKLHSPVLAYSGYALATTTGAFRMVNNKHWLSDVMVGAGIGILVTKLVYHFEPLKNFNPVKKSKNVSLVPSYNNGDMGVYFSCRF